MAQRCESWQTFVKQNPEGFIYCFRGGMRSKIVQSQLSQKGIHYPLVVGGYKALRNFLLDQIENLSQQRNFLIIAGRTGSGKTRIIEQFQQSIDLEKLANHRGSSFGKKTFSPTPLRLILKIALPLK